MPEFDFAALLHEEAIDLHLVVDSQVELMRALGCLAAAARPDLDAAIVAAALIARERLGSTGVGHGVALPHARLAGLATPLLIIGRSDSGVVFGTDAVHLVIAILVPEGAPGAHVILLAEIAAKLTSEHRRNLLLQAPNAAAVLVAFQGSGDG
jgi:mannitol/fructose-specific phosphotransferase system IIA component (Ntr-type)